MWDTDETDATDETDRSVVRTGPGAMTVSHAPYQGANEKDETMRGMRGMRSVHAQGTVALAREGLGVVLE